MDLSYGHTDGTRWAAMQKKQSHLDRICKSCRCESGQKQKQDDHADVDENAQE